MKKRLKFHQTLPNLKRIKRPPLTRPKETAHPVKLPAHSTSKTNTPGALNDRPKSKYLPSKKTVAGIAGGTLGFIAGDIPGAVAGYKLGRALVK